METIFLIVFFLCVLGVMLGSVYVMLELEHKQNDLYKRFGGVKAMLWSPGNLGFVFYLLSFQYCKEIKDKYIVYVCHILAIAQVVALISFAGIFIS